jgi:long-chain-fatty-acid--CoA ligase ACSBG
MLACPCTHDLQVLSSFDIPVMELYGLAECSGIHLFNINEAFQVGCAGRPMPRTESKVDFVTGELCIRGRHIFVGYFNVPITDTVSVPIWIVDSLAVLAP